jgi:head-tail adaptor
MSLRAGRLRHRVDVVRVIEVDDGKGGFVPSAQPVATSVPAEVVGLAGREAVLGQALQGISVYQITLRYRADLEGATELQLRYGALALNIRSAIDPDGRREQLLIVADTAGTLPIAG